MPITVEVPGQGDIDFPDGMSDEDISAAIRKLSPPATQGTSPLSFGRDVVRGAVGQGKEILGGFKGLYDAGKDILGNVTDPSGGGATIAPMLKGFAQGAKEGVQRFTDPAHFAETQEAFTGIHAAGDQPIGEKIGATGVNLAAMFLPVKAAGAVGRGLEHISPASRSARFLDRHMPVSPDARVASGLGTVPGPSAEEVARVAGGMGKNPPPPGSGVRGPALDLNHVLNFFVNEAKYADTVNDPIKMVSKPPAANPVSTDSTVETVARQRVQGRPVNREVTTAPPKKTNPAHMGGKLIPRATPTPEEALTGALSEALSTDTLNGPVKQVSLPPTVEVDPGYTVGTKAKKIAAEQPIVVPKKGAAPEVPVETTPDAALGDAISEQLNSDPATGHWRPNPNYTGTNPAFESARNQIFKPPYDPELFPQGRSHSLGSDEVIPNSQLRPGKVRSDQETITPGERDKISASFKDKGYDPSMEHEESGPPEFYRDPDGQLNIIEGNHRVSAAQEAGIDLPARVIQDSDLQTLDELRASGGADAAVGNSRVQKVAKELGIPIDRAFIQDATGGSSRRPLKASNTDLDNSFARLVADERGSAQTMPPAWGEAIEKLFGRGPSEGDNSVIQMHKEISPRTTVDESGDPVYSLGSDEADHQSRTAAQDRAIEVLRSPNRAGKMSTKDLSKLADRSLGTPDASLVERIRQGNIEPVVLKLKRNAADNGHSVSIYGDDYGTSGEFVIDGDSHRTLAAAKSLGVTDIPVRIEGKIRDSVKPEATTPYTRLYDQKTGKMNSGDGGLSLGKDLSKERPDEAGFFRPGEILSGLNQLRVASMLSGLALPKSILGNVGAIGTAATENATTAPIRELGNVPANLRSLKKGWQSGANPAGIGGSGKVNLPGRAIGAFDQATTDLLVRAGIPLDEVQRLLLTRPNRAAKELGIDSPVGKAIWPFQKTPFNQLKEGMSKENFAGKTPGMSGRKVALTVGAGAAGAALGASGTKDPRILGLAAALMGPRGLPFLLGAGFGGAGRNAVSGVSPLPEWGIPSDVNGLIRLTGVEPAAIRAFGPAQGSGGRNDRANNDRRERTTR